MDALVIQIATWTMAPSNGHLPHATEADALLGHTDFFSDDAMCPEDFALKDDFAFSFRSSIPTPWDNNNIVHGKLFACSADWNRHPTVILLHGWNDELGYRFRFPYLASLLRQHQINAAVIELPYHLQRRPTGAGAIQDFISADLWRMVEATRQSIADTRCLMRWLHRQGSPKVGLWGASLGAWLGGLIACQEPELDLAVLTTPVVRLEDVIGNLSFCAPIRSSFEKTNLSLARLNLVSHRPKMNLHRVLLQEALDDLFVSSESIEDLWRDWSQPEIWRLPHGHISILMSMPMMRRTVIWIAEKFSKC